ncbi:hypothetical protein ACPPVS_09695 [Cellulomonas sp. McL0617]|uniref:hypothetical protein n=1 Tax=Cellulomonas sp. McL0617 TaxID=3415675 RepID=UPI003CFB7F80
MFGTTWQDLLGVRWSWYPERRVRRAVAVTATAAVVAPLLLLTASFVIAFGVGWTAVIVATTALFVWVAEKWWIVFDADNLLLWLKFLPGIWAWVHEDDPTPEPVDEPRNPAFTQDGPPPLRW